MPYQMEISRNNPGLIFFLVDQSTSMSRRLSPESSRTLSQGTADAINHLLDNIMIRSTGKEGIRNYFDIGIIGYSSDVYSGIPDRTIDSLPLPLSDVVETARVEKRTRKIEDGAGGIIEEVINIPIWLDPKESGNTVMCKALFTCYSLIEKWISSHPNSFPPILINITDGEPTDGNPEIMAANLKKLFTRDGNVLLFNIHISPSKANPIIFPDKPDYLPDEFAKKLFNMSSTLPALVAEQAKRDGYSISNESKGFVFNSDLVTLISAIDIGTRVSREYREW